MRVKLAQIMAGPEGVWPAGEIIDLPDEQALELCISGQASEVEEPGSSDLVVSATEVEEDLERATEGPATPRRRPRQ